MTDTATTATQTTGMQTTGMQKSFDPESITITPGALAHVKRQLRGQDATVLVLGIRESGCNGYMYELDYARGDLADGRSFRFADGVSVFVEEENWPFVRGTEIDYETEGLNSMLTFNNPNADAKCGCGESFSIASSD